MAIGLIVGIFVVVLVVLALILWVVGIYNGFIRLKNNIVKSWANINVLLKQRNSELPKLIGAVKGYMKHEKGLLTSLTKARTAMLKAKDIHEKAKYSNQITAALKTLFAVAENYPKLRASENFQQLQSRISSLENEIADRREFYNDSVNQYNIKLESFPDKIIGNMMNLKRKEMFQVTPEEIKDIEVKF